MASVKSIEQARVERLAESLVLDLGAHGQVSARVSEIENLSRWRRAAVVAGKRLGWHVRTTVSGSERVVAYAMDRVINDDEKLAEARRMTDSLLSD